MNTWRYYTCPPRYDHGPEDAGYYAVAEWAILHIHAALFKRVNEGHVFMTSVTDDAREAMASDQCDEETVRNLCPDVWYYSVLLTPTESEGTPS